MTRVKVCGITRLEDGRMAAELGAWAIGLIFHAPSPRAVDPAAAEEIGATLRREVEVAGVFVNERLDTVAALAERCSLTLLQFHGEEGPAYCNEASRRTGCRVIKAIRAKDAAAVRALRAYSVDYNLLDAHVRGQRGGTGTTFAWELARTDLSGVPLIISGGITPDNAADAVRAVHPFAIDSASGTEAEPGRKDPAKLRALFRAVAPTPEPSPA
ncbi:MAG: phosphoribosylanthranilate isomerase [Thermoleophilaceae bacterium]